MKFLTKFSASFLLSLGFLFSMCALSQLPDMTDNNQPPYDKQEATQDFFSYMGVGVPMLLGGTSMLWGLRQKNRKQLESHLHSTFYQMLKTEDGRITVLGFAMEAQLSGVEAKRYLDEKAKEFNASFQVNSQGDISYHFYL